MFGIANNTNTKWRKGFLKLWVFLNKKGKDFRKNKSLRFKGETKEMTQGF